MNAITMTGYRRPDYTRQVVQSLKLCEGVADWVLFPHIEPGCDEVREIIESIDFCECRPIFNKTRFGLNKNSNAAMKSAYGEGADFIVHTEDDTLLSPDFLTYMDWAADEFALYPEVFSISGYNKLQKMPDDSEWYKVIRRDWFTCWGWGTWRHDMGKILAGWSFKNPKSFAWHINKKIRGNKIEVHPVLSRVQNIGYKNGENGRTPAWYRENHKTGSFAGDVPLPGGKFSEG